MNTLRIKILSGHASPKTLDFDENANEVRIGRAQDAEVRLDPDEDKAVTRGVHARLTRDEESGWQLECLHTSGVGVVGAGGRVMRRLAQHERTPVHSGQVFEIGNGGPHLRVEDPSASMVPTELEDTGGAPVPFTPRDVIGKARTSSKQIKALAVVGVITMVGVTIGIVAVNRSSTEQIEGAREEAREQALGVRQDAMRSLSELRELTASQAGVLASEIADVKGEISRVEEQAIDRMGATLAKSAESVWLVGVEDNAGGFTPVGTAWTVADSTLATNAHVVEGLMSKLLDVANAHMAARMTARNGDRRLILSNPERIHPAYAGWSGPTGPFASQFRALAGGGASRIDLIPPGDVALLRVESGDPGTPLPLFNASDARETTTRGMVVGYAGYPMENIAGLPAMQVVVGRVTAVTDYFFGEDPEGENLLIHYDAATVGGASGSPLVNSRGEVVGLVSAGNVAQVSADGDRAPIGFNYAQSVVLVREILEGVAESEQRIRDARWRARLSEVALAPDAMASRLIAEIAEGSEHFSVGDAATTLERAGSLNVATHRFRMEPGYRYIIVAVAEDWTDIDLFVVTDKQPLGKDDELDWYPVVVSDPVATPTEVDIHIVASQPMRSETCNVLLRIARVRVTR